MAGFSMARGGSIPITISGIDLGKNTCSIAGLGAGGQIAFVGASNETGVSN
jgi:hypothetical protein